MRAANDAWNKTQNCVTMCKDKICKFAQMRHHRNAIKNHRKYQRGNIYAKPTKSIFKWWFYFDCGPNFEINFSIIGRNLNGIQLNYVKLAQSIKCLVGKQEFHFWRTHLPIEHIHSTWNYFEFKKVQKPMEKRIRFIRSTKRIWLNIKNSLIFRQKNQCQRCVDAVNLINDSEKKTKTFPYENRLRTSLTPHTTYEI